MPLMQFSHGFRLDPIAKGSPQALVVLLHELGTSAAMLTPLAARWAATVPTTAFIALDGIEPVDTPSFELHQHTMADPDGRTEVRAVDRMARRLQPSLEHIWSNWSLRHSAAIVSTSSGRTAVLDWTIVVPAFATAVVEWVEAVAARLATR
jgi:phospholipase/carboxylesterase